MKMFLRMFLFFAASFGLRGLVETAFSQQHVEEWINHEISNLMHDYQWLHQNPELSFQETETARFLADALRQSGFHVVDEIGGHGVVGLLQNGDGPKLMLRCDLDALPVTEQTQLPYASTRRTVTDSGAETGVMHACGHDLHISTVIGSFRYLAAHRDRWKGTLMVIGQPAEERGQGAKKMLEDGLFERFGKPNFAVALHCSSDKQAGKVGLRSGYAMANVDSVDISVKGRGGHGSQPQNTIDPVVQAAHLVVSLQAIVSREINPLDPAVITVGSIHGGTKHNIIGDQCDLQITVRSYSDEVRRTLLDSIRRKAFAVANDFNAPEPSVIVSEGTPSLKNDPQLSERLRAVFGEAIGDANVSEDDPWMAGEDFSRYGRAGVPAVMYWLGTVSEQRLKRFEELGVSPPTLHSGLYYPDAEPALRTGIKTMVAAATNLLKP